MPFLTIKESARRRGFHHARKKAAQERKRSRNPFGPEAAVPFAEIKGDDPKIDKSAEKAAFIIGCRPESISILDDSDPSFSLLIGRFQGRQHNIPGVTDKSSDYSTIAYAGTIRRVPVLRLSMDDSDGTHHDYLFFKNVDEKQMTGRKDENLFLDRNNLKENLNSSLKNQSFYVAAINNVSYDPRNDSLVVEAKVRYPEGNPEKAEFRVKKVSSGKYSLVETFGLIPLGEISGNCLMENSTIDFGKKEESDMRLYESLAAKNKKKKMEESAKGKFFKFDEDSLKEQMNSTFDEIFDSEEYSKCIPFKVSSFKEAFYSPAEDALIVEAKLLYTDGETEDATFELHGIKEG